MSLSTMPGTQPMGYAAGGAINIGADPSQGQGQPDINGALDIVDAAMDYGRKLNGLGGAGSSDDSAQAPAQQGAISFDEGGAVDEDPAAAAYQAGPAAQFAPGASGAPDSEPAADAYQANSPDNSIFTGDTPQGRGAISQGAINDIAAAPGKVAGALTTDNPPVQAAVGAVQGAGAKIMRYLQGADAAPPQAVQQIEQQVDPQGQMDEGTRKLLTVQAAAGGEDGQGDPSKAWGIVQHYRQKYDAWKAVAGAALNGANGKPPNLAASTQYATKAYSNMLDGTSIVFQPGVDGKSVTAAVTTPGAQTKQVQMPVQAYNKFVNGPDGQYDNVYEKSGPAVIASLTKGLDQIQPADAKFGAGRAPGYTDQAPDSAGSSRVSAADDQNDINDDAAMAKRGSHSVVPKSTLPADLVAQGNEMFPGTDAQPQRNKWIQDTMKERADQGNKVTVAKTQGENAAKAWSIRGNTAENVAAMNASSREASSANRAKGLVDAESLRRDGVIQAAKMGLMGKQFQAAAGALDREITNMPLTGGQLTPQATKVLNAMYAAVPQNGQQPQAPQDQAPQVQAPQAPAPGQTQPSAGGKRPPPGYVKVAQ